mmetsp:Transcript_14359/g.22798  ORF Transcript_14359/g.22798 Transcript_14359/m.22798 type:complete len:203 (-) Transcript_14359:4-612(-)
MLRTHPKVFRSAIVRDDPTQNPLVLFLARCFSRMVMNSGRTLSLMNFLTRFFSFSSNFSFSTPNFPGRNVKVIGACGFSQASTISSTFKAAMGSSGYRPESFPMNRRIAADSEICSSSTFKMGTIPNLNSPAAWAFPNSGKDRRVSLNSIFPIFMARRVSKARPPRSKYTSSYLAFADCLDSMEVGIWSWVEWMFGFCESQV